MKSLFFGLDGDESTIVALSSANHAVEYKNADSVSLSLNDIPNPRDAVERIAG